MITALRRRASVGSYVDRRKDQFRKVDLALAKTPNDPLIGPVYAQFVHGPRTDRTGQARSGEIGVVQIVETPVRGIGPADVLVSVVVVIVQVGHVEPVPAVQIERELPDGVDLCAGRGNRTTSVVAHVETVDERLDRRRDRHLGTCFPCSPFDREEIECPVADQRTPDGAAILLRLERRHPRTRLRDPAHEPEVRFVERFVSEKIETAAMDSVAAGLEKDVDRSGAAPAKLGRIAGGHHLELLNRFLADGRPCAPRNVGAPAYDLVVEIDAFEPDRLVGLIHAEEADRVGTGGVPGRTLIEDDAGCQKREIHEIAVFQRQIANEPVADNGFHQITCGLDQRDGAFNRDRLGRSTDLKLEIDLEFPLDRQLDSRARDRGKTRQFDRHFVFRRWKADKAVSSFGARQGFAREARVGARGADHGPWNKGAGRVHDITQDGSIRRLCLGHGHRDQDKSNRAAD